MKYILMIGDGMADNPVAELGGKTPLQAAKTPFFDEIAKKGDVNRVLTVPEGLPPGSDTAILSIFGNDPRGCYTGRSPLEAAGCGVSLADGDVSYRCNMVAFSDENVPLAQRTILSHSAGSIEGEESKEMITALFSHSDFAPHAQKAGMTVHPAASFRHIAVQKGVCAEGMLLTPPHDHLGEPAGLHLPKGSADAAVLLDLMERAHAILDRHPLNEKRRAEGKLPANGIWFWAEGTAVGLESFYDKYGKTGAVVSAVPLCHGIARLSGLDVVLVEGATGELDTNYAGKVAAALAALETHDFVAIHIEAPDECTHNGDLPGKLQAIEYLDDKVIRPTVEGMKEDFRLLILSDHKTLTSTRGHDGDPVPYLIYDSRRDSGRGLPYDEASGEQGEYLAEGTQLMPLLFSE